MSVGTCRAFKRASYGYAWFSKSCNIQSFTYFKKVLILWFGKIFALKATLFTNIPIMLRVPIIPLFATGLPTTRSDCFVYLYKQIYNAERNTV